MAAINLINYRLTQVIKGEKRRVNRVKAKRKKKDQGRVIGRVDGHVTPVSPLLCLQPQMCGSGNGSKPLISCIQTV